MAHLFQLREKFFVLFLISISLPLLSIGQTKSDLVKISPKWEVGDVRQIHVELDNKMSFEDSVIRETKENYDVRLKVLAVYPNILLEWKSVNDLSVYHFKNEKADTNEIKSKLHELLMKAEEEVLQASRKLQMDSKTGKIALWTNGIELLKSAEYHQKKNLKVWCAEKDISASDQIALELEFSKRINQGFPIWKEMVLTQANSIFTSYQISFTVNKTLKEDIVTRDLLQMNDKETEFPGVLTKDATEVNDKLILNKKIEFNKEFVANYLRKTSATFTDLTSEEVIIFENEQSVFDLKSTWLLSHVKKMHFEVRGLKTSTRTTISFI